MTLCYCPLALLAHSFLVWNCKVALTQSVLYNKNTPPPPSQSHSQELSYPLQLDRHETHYAWGHEYIYSVCHKPYKGLELQTPEMQPWTEAYLDGIKYLPQPLNKMQVPSWGWQGILDVLCPLSCLWNVSFWTLPNKGHPEKMSWMEEIKKSFQRVKKVLFHLLHAPDFTLPCILQRLAHLTQI